MTPLHILALAQKPVVELLQKLLAGFDVARTEDFFGSTVLEYLSKNPLEEGKHATRWLVNRLVGERLPFMGLDRCKQELLAEEERVVRASKQRVSSNDEVQCFLDMLMELELVEMLSLLKLKLWKKKLDENLGKVKQDSSRRSCRVGCGISIVVQHVLPFLGEQVGHT